MSPRSLSGDRAGKPIANTEVGPRSIIKKFRPVDPTVFQQSTGHPMGIAGGPIPDGFRAGPVLEVGTWLGTPLYRCMLVSPFRMDAGQGSHEVHQSPVCRAMDRWAHSGWCRAGLGRCLCVDGVPGEVPHSLRAIGY